MTSDPSENPETESQYSLRPIRTSVDSESDAPIEADLIKLKPQPLTLSGMIAWAFVVLLTTFLVATVAYSQFSLVPKVGGDANSADLMQIQLQGKALVGQKQLLQLQSQPLPASASKVPEALDSGPYEQRLCFAILVNEIEGPDEALSYFEKLDEKVAASSLELTSNQEKMRRVLGAVIEDYEDGVVDPGVAVEERELVEEKLEWIGKLAFLPAETSQEEQRQDLLSEASGLMVVGIFAMMGGGFLGLVGFGLAVTFIILLANGKLKSGLGPRITNHNVYIETFAIWLGLFFGSSIVLGMIGVESRQVGMMIQPVVFFGSLLALVWPVVRGVPFRQVRQDIGWTAARPGMESLSAVPTYLATLPFLVPGVIFLTVIMSIVAGFQEPHEFARQFAPSHPVQEYISSGGLGMILLVFLTACVAAPVVEETMFRGVLYRHLRDWSDGWKRWTSVMFAAVINGLIFASIHPQGIYGIPVLMTLAIGFSLAREWRGSLVSSMVMHAIHNTLITCVSLLIL